jgi:hypothetical protein
MHPVHTFPSYLSKIHLNPIPRPCVTFHNKLVFYSKELLAFCPTSKLEDHPLSALHIIIIIIVVVVVVVVQNICSYPSYMEAISSIHNPRMTHAVVTGTQVTWTKKVLLYILHY